jgi:hypothetical protein
MMASIIMVIRWEVRLKSENIKRTIFILYFFSFIPLFSVSQFSGCLFLECICDCVGLWHFDMNLFALDYLLLFVVGLGVELVATHLFPHLLENWVIFKFLVVLRPV